MTEQELREGIHSAFYRIVRQLEPVPLDDFFKMTVEVTWPTGESPSGWVDFWWESVTVEIQSTVMSRREYVLDFNAKWLKDNKERTWNWVKDYIGRNLGPLT
jgi:hypothetical protein